jgi:WD40-like Beta Propeller Repeat
MPTLEEAMRDALRRHTPARDAGEVFDRLADRRRRRALTRKLGTIGLVVVVLGGTVGAFALLGHAFGTEPQPLQASTAGNGALVVSLQTEDGFALYVLPPEKQDLAPAASAVAANRDSMRYLTDAGSEADAEPAVSPDGTTVAFVRHARDLADGQGVLSTIGIDGTRESLVTRAPAQAADPAWSPDGQWIAFGAADEPEGRALYVIRPDGSDLRRVVTSDISSNPQSPAWSPDGSRIVFSGSASVDETADLWLADADGSGVRNLTSTTDVDETDPAWSPDGAWIAYATPDGIAQIPADGGDAQVLVPASGVPSDRLPAQPAWSPDGRYLAFAFGPTEPLPPVVYVLPVGGTTAFPLSQGWEFAWQPIPDGGVAPLPSVEHQLDLGLGYDVCRVSSMPINTNGVRGAAYVFTKRTSNGCPNHGEGLVGVDVDNDLVLDTTYGPLDDCFLRCEAFAAPDVNADGVSEIAVSTEGADGYGVWLFAISANGLTIDPINVEDPQRTGVVLDPLEFAWVDVATHFAGARCGTLDSGQPALIIDAGEKQGADADLRSTSLVLDGTTATIIDNVHRSIPMSEAPVPGHELCGTPLYNSAAAFPESVEPGMG